MRRLSATEDQIHRAVAEWVVLNEPRWPALKLMFHCPNGQKRTKFEQAQFKAMLGRAGVPDLMLPVRRAAKIGLAIELKSADGRNTKAQDDYQAGLIAEGWFVSVCRTPEDAIGRIVGYLSL